MADKHKSKHIKLTSHPGAGGAKPIPIHWGAADAHTRGPIIATLTTPEHRNVIGTHSGSYSRRTLRRSAMRFAAAPCSPKPSGSREFSPRCTSPR